MVALTAHIGHALGRSWQDVLRLARKYLRRCVGTWGSGRRISYTAHLTRGKFTNAPNPIPTTPEL